MHDTNEHASERLGAILDLPSPHVLANQGLDVWQAYGLHWFLCEIVGFVVRGPAADDDGQEDDKITDLTYSMRRWAHELHADEDAVADGFRVLHEMGIIRIDKQSDGRVTVEVPHLAAYADRVWNSKRAQQQRERRAGKRDSELTPSRLRADSSRKEGRKTRKGKTERKTSARGARFRSPAARGALEAPAAAAEAARNEEFPYWNESDLWCVELRTEDQNNASFKGFIQQCMNSLAEGVEARELEGREILLKRGYTVVIDSDGDPLICPRAKAGVESNRQFDEFGFAIAVAQNDAPGGPSHHGRGVLKEIVLA